MNFSCKNGDKVEMGVGRGGVQKCNTQRWSMREIFSILIGVFLATNK